MISFTCPKCDQSGQAAPGAAGQQVQCGRCGAVVAVPGAAPSSAPPLRTRRTWNPLFVRGLVTVVVIVVVLLGVGGYLAYQRWFASNVSIYVDNTGDQPLTVRLDGSDRATVAPGTFAVVGCRDGSHRIEAVRGGTTVFDETKELSRPTQNKPSQYLLNPDDTGRYHTHSVQYGAAFMPWGLSNLRPIVARFRPLIADDANLFPGLREEQVQHDLFWACNHDLSLVQPAAWHDISKYDIVLERAPKQIKGEITGTQEVFARMSKADYASFKTLAGSDKMTKQQLADVVRALERVLDAELPR
jgi:hypothetical protein